MSAVVGTNISLKSAIVVSLKNFKDAGIASMAKHFPGYGSVATDAHKGLAEIVKSFEELDAMVAEKKRKSEEANARRREEAEREAEEKRQREDEQRKAEEESSESNTDEVKH